MELLRAQVDLFNRLYWVMSGETIDPPEIISFTPPSEMDERTARNPRDAERNSLSQENL